MSGQFQKHGIVEELVDGHVFAEALASSGLHHELARQVRGRLGFERPQDDALVERIARHDLPVMKHRQTEGLALCVRSKIRFEAEGIDGRNKSLDIKAAIKPSRLKVYDQVITLMI